MDTDRDKFARENFNLIYKFLSVYHINDKKEEILDVLYIGFTKALNDYDPSRGSFSTIAFACMESAYFHWLNVNNRPKRDAGAPILSLDAYVGDDESITLLDMIPDDNVNIEEEIYNKILLESADLIAKKILKKREYTVYEKCFKKGMSGTQIAKEFGVSKQVVDVIKHKALRKLTKYFKDHPNDFRVPKEEKKRETIDDILYDMFADENNKKEEEGRSVEELLYEMVGGKL